MTSQQRQKKLIGVSPRRHNELAYGSKAVSNVLTQVEGTNVCAFLESIGEHAATESDDAALHVENCK